MGGPRIAGLLDPCGWSTGRILTADGDLAVSVVQEGLLRLRGR